MRTEKQPERRAEHARSKARKVERRRARRERDFWRHLYETHLARQGELII